MCWKLFIIDRCHNKQLSPPRTKDIGVKPIKMQFVIKAKVMNFRVDQSCHLSIIGSAEATNQC